MTRKDNKKITGLTGYQNSPKPIKEWSDRLADRLFSVLGDVGMDGMEFRENFYNMARQSSVLVIDASYVDAFVPIERRRDKMTVEDGLRVCELYSHIGVKQRACQIVGYHEITFDELREREPELERVWCEAETAFGERVYQEVVRRAIDGVDEPRFNAKTGRIIGYVNKKSDRMLEMLAKAKFPSVFRDTYHRGQKAKAETANIDFNRLSTEVRLIVRKKITEIREIIAVDMARDVTPGQKAIGKNPDLGVDGQ